VGYCFATASPTDAFLAFSVPKRGRRDEPIGAGYLLREGIRSALVDGTRTVERDPQHGWVTHVDIDAIDEQNRRLNAVGTPVNRVVFLPYPRMLNWTSMTRWTFGSGEPGASVEGWGEDQDVWRPDQWRAFRASPVD
jgi:hypothetical protein